MDIIQLEKLQQKHLQDTQELMNTMIQEIKLKQKSVDLMSAQKQEKIELLQEENKQLNQTISDLYAQMANLTTKLSELNNKLLRQEPKDLEEASEEEYEEVIDCCLQAHINEHYTIVKRCIREIIHYYKSFEKLMTTEMSITLLLIAFLQEEDQTFYTTYKEYIDDTLKEHEIYKSLSLLRKGVPINVETYEELIRTIKLENVHPYIVDELREDIYSYIKKRLEELQVKAPNKHPKGKTVEIRMEPDASEKGIKVEVATLYDMSQLINRIKAAFGSSDKNTLRRLFNQLITNYEHYEQQLNDEYIQTLLGISYFENYDKQLIDQYSTIKEFVKTNKARLYKLLIAERENQRYKAVNICLTEYIHTEGKNIRGFGDFNTSYMKRRLQEVAMPCIDKLYDMVEDRPCKHSKDFYRTKWVWMKQRKMNQFLAMETIYCSKCNHYYIAREEKERLNDYHAPYRINTISSIVPVDKRKSKEQDNALNTTSLLKEMGYETTKSKEERWNLLRHIIIPRLGKAKVVNHLKFLVRLHGKNPQMRHAVSEWEYDLGRL